MLNLYMESDSPSLGMVGLPTRLENSKGYRDPIQMHLWIYRTANNQQLRKAHKPEKQCSSDRPRGDKKKSVGSTPITALIDEQKWEGG